MQDTWVNHNLDKLLLFAALLLMGSMIIHILHHAADSSLMSWAENEFSTVLGALILILTGRVNRANADSANTSSTTVSITKPQDPIK